MKDTGDLIQESLESVGRVYEKAFDDLLDIRATHQLNEMTDSDKMRFICGYVEAVTEHLKAKRSSYK
ncbi:hypothetical protein [Dongshaea marina]|uniref:hypothetical protein n=1 Tax=Dongshaea marina TaxID=2047966 RepID=UPI000D3E6DFA|nr:hypothetical protein [Dongshaea marina]